MNLIKNKNEEKSILEKINNHKILNNKELCFCITYAINNQNNDINLDKIEDAILQQINPSYFSHFCSKVKLSNDEKFTKKLIEFNDISCCYSFLIKTENLSQISLNLLINYFLNYNSKKYMKLEPYELPNCLIFKNNNIFKNYKNIRKTKNIYLPKEKNNENTLYNPLEKIYYLTKIAANKNIIELKIIENKILEEGNLLDYIYFINNLYNSKKLINIEDFKTAINDYSLNEKNFFINSINKTKNKEHYKN